MKLANSPEFDNILYWHSHTLLIHIICLWKRNWQYLANLHTNLPFDPETPHLGIFQCYAGENANSRKVFTAAPFAITQK